VIAKVSRLEVAEKFLNPPPEGIVTQLRAAGRLTNEEAEVARHVSVASDLCVESDSGGHTDRGSALTLVPSILALRRRLSDARPSGQVVRVGAAGGIGTPAAVAATLALGAEFVLTGSVNQCTVEAGTSDQVKDLLGTLGVHDTAMAPAADLFEVDGGVQVVRKGTMFASRANRLHRIFREHRVWHDVDPTVRAGIEKRVLKRPFEDVLEDLRHRHAESERWRSIEQDPRAQMAAVFKTYLERTTVAATEGYADEAADFQIHCGPALGAFNEWVSGTPLESWRARHVDHVADALMGVVEPGAPSHPVPDAQAMRVPTELTWQH
jgi:trans-AT polyketide synthase/acyltransferase/oxidoreductase domain-containing protein